MMTSVLTIRLSEQFGHLCLDSRKAINLLRQEIVPALMLNARIVIDIRDVRVINSSFAKALFGNLSAHLGDEFSKRIGIEGTNPELMELVETYVQLGQQHHTPTQNLA